MNLLSLTACTLLLCFATSCEAAKKGFDELVIIDEEDEAADEEEEAADEEEEEAPEEDWTGQDDIIVRLADRVKKMEKSFREFQNLYKRHDKQMKAFDRQLKSILDVVEQQGITLAQCCSGAPEERILSVDVDDSVTLYLDGKEIKDFQHANDWRLADSTPLPSDTKVIAVKGSNRFGDPGILASTPDGYVLTNTSWKCKNKEAKGWKKVDFDDSRWSHAYVVLPATKKPIEGIRDDASWIWTKNFHYVTGDKEVYCRLKLQ